MFVLYTYFNHVLLYPDLDTWFSFKNGGKKLGSLSTSTIVNIKGQKELSWVSIDKLLLKWVHNVRSGPLSKLKRSFS